MDKRKRRLLCMLEGSGRKSRWISGAPPLSFRAFAAGTLDNYRIYGNTVGGESVGDLVESGEHSGEYRVPVTVSNGTDTLTTPIYLPEQIRKVGDDAEYIDYGEQKQHRVRKNLCNNNWKQNQTINGVTFTMNSDGSVTCNGTATKHASLRINIGEIPIGIYIVSGCPKNGAYNTYRLDVRDSSDTVIMYNSHIVLDTGNGHLFNSTNADHVEIRIENGYTCDNLTFYPMIRLATIDDDTYEPYIENTDLDVTLPALSTIKGTNVLSVGTTVQPSKIEVKGKIKAL